MGAYFDWWDGTERRALLLEGERLTVGSAADNDVVVEDVSEWDLGVDKWIDSGCAIAGRDLDERDWREAFPDRPYRRTCQRAGQ